MADAATSCLKRLSSKRLPQSIRYPFTAYSHKHDLLAVVVGPPSGESAWEVQVYRIASGQNAFTVKRADAVFSETDIEVTAIAWKPDGTSLGVGWSDGKYGIYDGESGRQMGLAELPSDGPAEEFALDLKLPTSRAKFDAESVSKASHVAVMGFMQHDVVDKRSPRGKVVPQEYPTTDDWYDMLDQDSLEDHKESKSTQKNVVTELPRAIASLDVTTVLPRLSAIPSHGLVQPKSGSGASKFGSQAATDTQFDCQQSSTSDAVQTLLVCRHDGPVKILVDETVEIGAMTSAPRPIAHAAHRRASTHAVLCEGAESASPLQLTLLDLPLSTLNGPLLHVIATNTKRIQTLLDYIVQTARCIQFDYTTNVAIPLRFINVLSMDMKDKHPNDGDALANLYHLAMTGSFHPQVLEWIMDIVKDTNIRRWEMHMNTMYDNIQSHIFMNLLPALDRFSIALTALRGQARYYENSTSFECSPKYYDVLLQNIDSIRLVAQKMQLIVQGEHRQFRAFIKWLKLQVEIAAAEPFSQNAMDTEEREVPNIDYALVLTYIKYTLLRSKLATHIENRPTAGEGATCDMESFMAADHIRDMGYERTRSAMHQLNSDQALRVPDVVDPEALINLPALVCGLMGRTHVTVQHVTEWQNRLVFPPTKPPTILLEDWDDQAKVLDMAMELTKDDDCAISILGLSMEADSQVSLLRVSSSSTITMTSSGQGNGALNRRRRQWTQGRHELRTDQDLQGVFLDAKFMPHITSTILALFRPREEDCILLIACDVTEQTELQETRKKHRVLHQFLPEANFRPEKLLIGGRLGKLLCIIFGNRGREWEVLDLDAGSQPNEASYEHEQMELE
ncbi:Putative quinoprotein amine dehydrogenase, beta chain [Septoria linicola]|uniref:Anaphase-promoting complex subunit 4 n=1 Tax=Septoria linicola TaxID=215465 RepID=A0A9Q9APK9_9PEZI|nr:putative quinoprotein amine dehydrogenase, beta chain [Septoria linicola]USW49888.1 Putative quinoprotein amine dehydrogenase, beta chain [Septoria linicola]